MSSLKKRVIQPVRLLKNMDITLLLEIDSLTIERLKALPYKNVSIILVEKILTLMPI